MPKVHKKAMKGSLGTSFIIEKVPAQRKLSCSKCIYFDTDGSCNKLSIVISEVGYDYFKHCKYFDREDKPKKQGVKEVKTGRSTNSNKKTNIINKQVRGIRVNSSVQLYDYKFKETVEYYLVEPSKSNPIEGKISIDSPFGKALLGKRQREEVQVKTPLGIDTYKIVSWKER